MYTIISKDIKIKGFTNEILKWAEDRLTLDNPEYKQMKIMGKENIIKWKHIPEKIKLYAIYGDTLVLPFGLLRSVWNFISKDKYELNFNNAGEISFKNDIPEYDLYEYQEPAVQEMLKRKGGVLVASCGSGKTTCGMELIKRIGRKALWICHTGDLLRQAKKDLLQLYPNAKIGLTTEGKLEIGEDITISTVQTLVKIDPSLYADQFDTIVVDECAHTVSSPTKMQMFGKVLSSIPARYKIGLTATPERADKMTKAMYAYIGTDKDGLFQPMYKVDREQVKTMPAEHVQVELNNGYEDCIYKFTDTSGMIVYNKLIETLSGDLDRTEQIIDNIVKCDKEGRKQVVLTLRVEHCEYIVQRLQERGVNAVLCVGKTSAKKREEILTQKVEWSVLVATYSLLKEGVSVKELDTLHLATPVKDKAMCVQCVGRIERFLEGKKQPIAYDYVDTDIPYCVRAYTARRRALKTRF